MAELGIKMDKNQINKLKKEMPDVYNKLLQMRGILNSILEEKPNNQVKIHGNAHKIPASNVQKPKMQYIQQKTIQRVNDNKVASEVVLEQRKKQVQNLINNMLNEIRKRQSANPNVQIRSIRVDQKSNVKSNIQGQQKQIMNKNMPPKNLQNNQPRQMPNRNQQKPMFNKNKQGKPGQNNQQKQVQNKPVQQAQVQKQQVKQVSQNTGMKNRTDLNKYL